MFGNPGLSRENKRRRITLMWRAIIAKEADKGEASAQYNVEYL